MLRSCPGQDGYMNVGVLLYHHVGEFEVAAPTAVLGSARRFQGDDATIEPFTVARSRFSVQTVSGLTLTPKWAFASVPRTDVLIVPGGLGVERAAKDLATIRFLATTSSRATVVAAIGSGAVLLGVAGVLRDQNICGPPELLERLEEFEVGEHRQEALVRNPTGVWCAGTPDAGVDLALALVREHAGPDLARKVATALGC